MKLGNVLAVLMVLGLSATAAMAQGLNSIKVVPEPSTVIILAMGATPVVAFLLSRRKR